MSLHNGSVLENCQIESNYGFDFKSHNSVLCEDERMYIVSKALTAFFWASKPNFVTSNGECTTMTIEQFLAMDEMVCQCVVIRGTIEQ